jgi:hypothetical protein
LLLKHGVGIEGTWSMLGVLDALPISGFDEMKADLSQVTAAESLGALGLLLGKLGPAIRRMLGRPDGSYGITPLLIFREVSI